MTVEIFGASWCSACESAVDLCESKGLRVEYVDIDDAVNLRKLEERLGVKARSVPQIFLDVAVVSGGYGELQQMVA